MSSASCARGPRKARQLDILRLVCSGLHNNEIARRLKITERGVKWHVGELLLHFGVRNRTELAGICAAYISEASKTNIEK